jgi:hypothetical protein
MLTHQKRKANLVCGFTNRSRYLSYQIIDLSYKSNSSVIGGSAFIGWSTSGFYMQVSCRVNKGVVALEGSILGILDINRSPRTVVPRISETEGSPVEL